MSERRGRGGRRSRYITEKQRRLIFFLARRIAEYRGMSVDEVLADYGIVNVKKMGRKMASEIIDKMKEELSRYERAERLSEKQTISEADRVRLQWAMSIIDEMSMIADQLQHFISQNNLTMAKFLCEQLRIKIATFKGRVMIQSEGGEGVEEGGE